MSLHAGLGFERSIPVKKGVSMAKASTGPDEFSHPTLSFAHLSLRDLMEAQHKYHADLMRHPNVVATAVGRYRIRKGDSWPTSRGTGRVHGTGLRTLANSEMRPYSWPAILVFVDRWQSQAELAKSHGLGGCPKRFISPTNVQCLCA
jgi:hypothetical protein